MGQLLLAFFLVRHRPGLSLGCEAISHFILILNKTVLFYSEDTA